MVADENACSVVNDLPATVAPSNGDGQFAAAAAWRWPLATDQLLLVLLDAVFLIVLRMARR